ncbi:Co-chaperone Hsc20 [Lentithecium fluviatile CBS 122367]|uniref:Co-chaperone Hsc20 n=1 Tax=Lentithecium fluviatile CBS 122367 TaxID=1168545 RepID=A0A6G1IWR2_9PLEO|nr:Co-chaperone Hsc20 [Lentithecium fluviatile CBS 122367]
MEMFAITAVKHLKRRPSAPNFLPTISASRLYPPHIHTTFNMRPVRSAARSSLRASVNTGSTPFLRTRPIAAPCLLCAHRISPSQPSRRHQSSFTPEKFSPQDRTERQTHYHFFPNTLPSGPPPHGRFAIDTTALKHEFLRLQSRAHPDLHPSEDKLKAQALSARINEAYKTLQSPLLRAQYLLTLRGIEVAEDETAKVEDPELLMEVLDARERIEEAQSEEDLEEMKAENDVRIEESVKILEAAFERDDVGEAKHEAVKLRYWINIKDSLDQWEKGKPIVLQH